ncbi:hypothetical protein E2C01_041922 [Portunus trituberculatus]|uniref:Uncharacterized protein n=1 Tax=Portunus trituberculatus TaxID=210409 RepID=A0A5B7FRZ8_PORTR|nr:hypothetical protein [Portunus trituberculatus]
MHGVSPPSLPGQPATQAVSQPVTSSLLHDPSQPPTALVPVKSYTSFRRLPQPSHTMYHQAQDRSSINTIVWDAEWLF